MSWQKLKFFSFLRKKNSQWLIKSKPTQLIIRTSDKMSFHTLRINRQFVLKANRYLKHARAHTHMHTHFQLSYSLAHAHNQFWLLAVNESEWMSSFRIWIIKLNSAVLWQNRATEFYYYYSDDNHHYHQQHRWIVMAYLANTQKNMSHIASRAHKPGFITLHSLSNSHIHKNTHKHTSHVWTN